MAPPRPSVSGHRMSQSPFRAQTRATLHHAPLRMWRCPRPQVRRIAEGGWLWPAGIDAPTNEYDFTALHQAARSGAFQVVEFLLARGASVLRGDSTGYTSLHKAAGAGAYRVCRVLLDGGADRDATDREGDTPLQVVQRLLAERRHPFFDRRHLFLPAMPRTQTPGNLTAVRDLLDGGAARGEEDRERRARHGGQQQRRPHDARDRVQAKLDELKATMLQNISMCVQR